MGVWWEWLKGGKLSPRLFCLVFGMSLSEKVIQTIIRLFDDPSAMVQPNAFESMHFVVDGDAGGGWVEGAEPKDDTPSSNEGLASRLLIGYIDRGSVISMLRGHFFCGGLC